MCGIVGVADPMSSDTVIEPIVRRMAAIISHRGPDDDGFFSADGIGLGMRRLSIIDLAGGKQPIRNEDGSVTIVFNSEIYNYRELRRQLQRRGHLFILIAIRKSSSISMKSMVKIVFTIYGECLPLPCGMLPGRTLLVAGDRLGIKPLYYISMGSRLLRFRKPRPCSNIPQWTPVSILKGCRITCHSNMCQRLERCSREFSPCRPATCLPGIQTVSPSSATGTSHSPSRRRRSE